jgi:hypothetical protein
MTKTVQGSMFQVQRSIQFGLQTLNIERLNFELRASRAYAAADSSIRAIAVASALR